MHFRLRKGLDIALDGAPEPVLRDGAAVSTVAVLGKDYPGVRPDFRVAQGDRVTTGQVLFVDRRRPQICFTAPATGPVLQITAGPRRALDALVIGVEEDTAAPVERPTDHGPSVRALLLASGLWTSFRTRPFGRIPDPDAEPAAIFVTAMETEPLAADAAVVLKPHLAPFRRGLDVLKALTAGPVFVCQAPGTELAVADERLRPATFAGPHPAGLAGTHIHHLMPASAGRTVWHIGYQDVVAIGHLAATGLPWTERTVAVGGPGALRPGLVRTRVGASLDDLLAGETRAGDVRWVSGSILSGRASSHLGRYHTQVTVLTAGRPPRTGSIVDAVLGWLPRAPAGPTLPVESIDDAMPLRILPLPLMRALSIGDVETAERLGCLELVEEDVALLSWLCPGGTDYGVLLRQALDELDAGRA